jgi:hypothetical protein
MNHTHGTLFDFPHLPCLYFLVSVSYPFSHSSYEHFIIITLGFDFVSLRAMASPPKAFFIKFHDPRSASLYKKRFGFSVLSNILKVSHFRLQLDAHGGRVLPIVHDEG